VGKGREVDEEVVVVEVEVAGRADLFDVLAHDRQHVHVLRRERPHRLVCPSDHLQHRMPPLAAPPLLATLRRRLLRRRRAAARRELYHAAARADAERHAHRVLGIFLGGVAALRLPPAEILQPPHQRLLLLMRAHERLGAAQ
jgi:hypothetical protein